MEKPNVPQSNPLSKYFRQPAIYIKLPSKGQYWPDGAVEIPVTGELPVYPMTAKDEVTLRTPDALMNGSGVVDVIHSCCPSIKNAWEMPSVDVDAVLIGIRIASYGHEMDIETTCPHCKEENKHAIDLRVSLDSIKCPDYDEKITEQELKFKVKPQQYFGVNRGNAINFEEQRLADALERVNMDATARTTVIAESMGRLLEISIETVTQSTEYIELADGTQVNDKAFIKEFYNNSDGVIVRAIQSKLANINTEGAVKPQKAACTACKTEYEIPLEFDYSNFFANGS
jgi:hypothetical protein